MYVLIADWVLALLLLGGIVAGLYAGYAIGRLAEERRHKK